MNCVYCHASSRPVKEKKYDMDLKTAKKVVDFIFQSPSQQITLEFQGGEPLLNFRVLEYIVNYAKKKNEAHKKDLQISVVSNLSLMDEKKLEFLIKNGVAICTSLDGPEQLHDKNRAIKGETKNHCQVSGWIQKINQEYGKRGATAHKVNALITLTKDSLDYPKEIVDEYVKNGLETIHLRFLNNLGVASRSWGKISYSAEEYIDFWKTAVEHMIKLNKRGVDIRERIVRLMVSKIVTGLDPNYLDLRSPCGAAIGQLAYNYNGDIYTCDEGRMVGGDLFKLGNVKKDRYANVLTSNKVCAMVAASINDGYICDSCAFKPYCGICPVCNYAEQGSIIGKIPQTDRCKIFKSQFKYVFEKLLDKKDSKVILEWAKNRKT